MAHHHHRPRPHSSTTTNIPSTTTTIAGAGYYDDVFKGAGATLRHHHRVGRGVAFAPHPNEYAEIFGGFRSRAATSIPILEIPTARDEVAVEDVDVFDYEEVFGGGREVVIGVPYEWFVREEEEEEEEEVLSPAGSGSFSEESGASAYSEGNQFMQMENHHRKNFNASYPDAVLTSGEGDLNGIHVAKYDSFPGYTHVADGFDKFIPQKLTQDRFVKQPLSHTSHHGSEIQSERKRGKTHGTSRSPMNPTSVFVSDISLRTQSSHVPPSSRPPPLPVERDGFSGNLSSAPMHPKVFAHEIAEDDSSPIFFDAEVDGSLFVADSAASMDVVIEKAEASLRTVKELMMRKNDGCRSHSSSGRDIDSDSGRKGGMISKGILEDHRCNTSREREQNGRENPRKERRGGCEAVPVLSYLSVHSLNVPQKPSQKKHKRKKSAVVDPSLTEGTGKWMEAMKYYEHTKGDNCMFATMLPNSAENVAVLEAPDYSNCCSNGKKASSDVRNSSDEGIEAARRASGHREKVVMPSNSMDVDYDLKEHKQRPKLAKSAIGSDSLEEMVHMAHEISDRVVYEHTEVNKSLERDRKGLMDERNLRAEKAVEKNERQPIIACQLPDHDFSYVELCLDKEEYEGELWETLQREEENKKVKEDCERERHEKELKETSDKERRQRKLKVAHRKEEKEDRQNPRAVLQNGSRRNEACNKDDNQQVVQESNKRNAEDRSAGCRIKLSHDKDRSVEKLEMAANGNSSKVSPHMDDNMGMAEVSASEGCAVNEASDLAWVESNNRGADGFECFPEDANLARYEEHGEALDTKESKRGDDDVEHLRLFNKSPELEAVSEKPIHASEASVTVEDMDNSLLGHDLRTFEVRVGRLDTPAMTGLFLPGFSKLLAGDYNLGKKSKPDVLGHEHGFLQNSSEAQGAVGQVVSDRTQQVVAESNYDAIKTEKVEIAGITTECPGQGDAQDELPEFKVEEVLSSDRLDGLTMKFNDVHIVSDHTIDDRKEATTPSLTKNIGEAVVGRMNNVVEAPVSYHQEVNSSSSEPIQGLTGISGESRFMQAAQAVISETKQNINKRSQPSGTSQHTVRKGNEGNAVDKEEPVKTDKELENEHRRKLEEEREKERSKDRKAVDMMKSEARERPNLERPTLESRQKAMAEARERLERACAEARERSSAEKTAAEAKLRAERAAVERANAEAKQRLLEKVTVQARERIERSVSDKLSLSSRSMDMRQGSSLSSRDNCHGGGCESAQRYNARLESNRRTAERMAEALVVKKTRDLVAQREHAERNRLAETLDADIKRWSNGKEGNLRALLSTLQYILGPDSGWQPIPLTDVITAAAAKKAYRKAALYVHPDKVQQRGANVRQKYICEKVFYLLQDAWNKFNSGER